MDQTNQTCLAEEAEVVEVVEVVEAEKAVAEKEDSPAHQDQKE